MTSLGKAFDGSCERIQDFTVAADVHTHPLSGFWGLKPSVNNFSMNDFRQAIQLKTKDYPLNTGEMIPIGSSVYTIETRNLVPDLEKMFMINERDSQIYVFAPQLSDTNIKPEQIETDVSLVIYNPIWKQYSQPPRVWVIGSYQ
jgi:hypothetical protein